MKDNPRLCRKTGIRLPQFSFFLILIICCYAVISCSQEETALLPEENPVPGYGVMTVNTAADFPNVILNLDKIPWDKSNVYRAMCNRKPVAEVCKEYISAIDRQAIVIYPTDQNGVADLTQGFVAQVIGDLNTGKPDAAKIHGGSVAFSLNGETTACNYTAGTFAAWTLIYVSKTRDIGGAEEATFTAYTITDNNPNRYGVVKIGTQYWMRENLKASYYIDDTEIPDSYNNGEYGKLYSWDSMNDKVIIDG